MKKLRLTIDLEPETQEDALDLIQEVESALQRCGWAKGEELQISLTFKP